MTEQQKKFFLTLLDTIKMRVDEGNLDDVEALFAHGISAVHTAIDDNKHRNGNIN